MKSRKRNILFGIFLSLLYLFIVVSCQSVTENDKAFSIYFLDTMDTFKGNSYEEIQMKINQLDLDQAVVTLTSPDIEAYFWKDQKIVLTEEATRQLGDLSNKENCNLKHFGEFDQDSKTWCAISELEDKVFVVTLNDTRYYGGLSLRRPSERWWPYPVLYPYQENGKVTLSLRPIHDPIHYPLGNYSISVSLFL